jgi:hypothetical protein
MEITHMRHFQPSFSAQQKRERLRSFVDGPRGQSLLYRGSHVMSPPKRQDNLAAGLASMDDPGIGVAILSVDTRRRDLPSASPADFKSAGYPGETAMAATKLALAGVLADYPDVKIICSHLARRWFAVVAVSVTLAAPIRPVTTCIVATLIPRALMVLR